MHSERKEIGLKDTYIYIFISVCILQGEARGGELPKAVMLYCKNVVILTRVKKESKKKGSP